MNKYNHGQNYMKAYDHPGWMHYFKGNGLVFHNIPKNASSTTSTMFQLNHRQHSYENVENTLCGLNFTILREPMDRLVSTYLHYEEGKGGSPTVKKQSYWTIVDKKLRVAQFINNLIVDLWDVHLSPQLFFVVNRKYVQYPIDYIIDFRNVGGGLTYLAELCDLEVDEVPKINTCQSDERDEIREIMEEFYPIIRWYYAEDFYAYERLQKIKNTDSGWVSTKILN